MPLSVPFLRKLSARLSASPSARLSVPQSAQLPAQLTGRSVRLAMLSARPGPLPGPLLQNRRSSAPMPNSWTPKRTRAVGARGGLGGHFRQGVVHLLPGLRALHVLVPPQVQPPLAAGGLDPGAGPGSIPSRAHRDGAKSFCIEEVTCDVRVLFREVRLSEIPATRPAAPRAPRKQGTGRQSFQRRTSQRRARLLSSRPARRPSRAAPASLSRPRRCRGADRAVPVGAGPKL